MKVGTLIIGRRGFIPLILLVSLFIMATLAFAETKVFIEEYNYQASEYDSKVSSRALAFDQVKRLLLEKLGTYLESETEVKNFQLTKDRIIILTAGIVRAEIIEERWDGKTYFLKAKISADSQDVANSLDKLRQDRQKTKELEETKKKADEALKEVERLKKELETAKAGKTEQEQYNRGINRLSAIVWFQAGLALQLARQTQEAIEAYSRGIDLNPTLAEAYANRSFAYSNLGNYQQALADSNKAIQLDPKLAMAYVNRSLAYFYLGNYQQVLADSDKAIELDPKLATAYANRSSVYSNLGNYQKVLVDSNKAIELDPKLAIAYCNRGNAYWNLGYHQQGIA